MAIKHKFITLLTLAFAVFAFTTFAAAQETVKTDGDATTKIDKREFRKGKRDGMGGRGFGKRGGKRGGMHAFRGLNLTEEQKAQMKSIREANRPDPSVREELRTLMQAKRDGTMTAEQKERAEALKAQGREKGEVVRQQMLAVLTVEQRQQMEQKKQEMKQRFQDRRMKRDQMREKKTPETPKTDM